MATDRIPLQRAVAVVRDDRIAVYPSRAQVVGALVEVAIAAGAVWLMVAFFDVLPLFVLVLLLVITLVLGPFGVLGLVFGIVGTSFLMERGPASARWQQGFLGMGIGTTEYVAFPRIARMEVTSDAEVPLRSGERQDMVTWEVELVKDNDRRIPVASVVAPRSLAEDGAGRANRLASALAEMAGVEARLAAVPEAAEAGAQGEALAGGRGRRARRYRRVARSQGAPGAGPGGEAE